MDNLIKETALIRAREFVKEQSEGEWDDAMIEKDAIKLADLMLWFRNWSVD